MTIVSLSPYFLVSILSKYRSLVVCHGSLHILYELDLDLQFT